jgi:hypothetical protein
MGDELSLTSPKMSRHALGIEQGTMDCMAKKEMLQAAQ